jgi:small subunit ribosomal protein S11
MAKKKKARRSSAKAIAHVMATFNNTMVTITDLRGDTLTWATAGGVGFKGSRKSTPFAAQKAAEKAAVNAIKMGVKEVEVRVNGPGSGRESAVRALSAAGLNVRAIEDRTPLPPTAAVASRRVERRRRRAPAAIGTERKHRGGTPQVERGGREAWLVASDRSASSAAAKARSCS